MAMSFDAATARACWYVGWHRKSGKRRARNSSAQRSKQDGRFGWIRPALGDVGVSQWNLLQTDSSDARMAEARPAQVLPYDRRVPPTSVLDVLRLVAADPHGIVGEELLHELGFDGTEAAIAAVISSGWMAADGDGVYRVTRDGQQELDSHA